MNDNIFKISLIFLERLQTSTTTTFRRLRNTTFCQNVVPVGTAFWQKAVFRSLPRRSSFLGLKSLQGNPENPENREEVRCLAAPGRYNTAISGWLHAFEDSGRAVGAVGSQWASPGSRAPGAAVGFAGAVGAVTASTMSDASLADAIVKCSTGPALPNHDFLTCFY